MGKRTAMLEAMAESVPAVKERPILFRGPMVRAILEGRKTQTRRLFKGSAFDLTLWVSDTTNNPNVEKRCPYGRAGDRLWVRENHYLPEACTSKCVLYEDGKERTVTAGGLVMEGEDTLKKLVNHPGPVSITEARYIENRGPLKPSIHMPRWACRIELEIVKVRVERLQEISGQDVLAEGFDNGKSNPTMGKRWENMQRMCWQETWDSHNAAPCDWASNPWVWVVEFKRV